MAIADLSYMHAAGDGGPRSRTQVVVIHATDNTAAASAEASYATRRPDKTSAHFYVDDNLAIRALPLGNIAYGCLYHGNQISVQFELCGRSNAISDATMRRAAPIVAEVCRQYGLPMVKVSAAQVAAGAKGICGHLDITHAFPQDGGDHSDPGARFDWSKFINYVQGMKEDDMALTDKVPAANNRDVGTVLSDLYNAEMAGHSGFVATDKSYRTKQLDQLVTDVAALKAAVAKLATPTVTLDAAALAQIVAGLPKAPTAAEVAQELAKRIGNG